MTLSKPKPLAASCVIYTMRHARSEAHRTAEYASNLIAGMLVSKGLWLHISRPYVMVRVEEYDDGWINVPTILTEVKFSREVVPVELHETIRDYLFGAIAQSLYDPTLERENFLLTVDAMTSVGIGSALGCQLEW